MKIDGYFSLSEENGSLGRNIYLTYNQAFTYICKYKIPLWNTMGSNCIYRSGSKNVLVLLFGGDTKSQSDMYRGVFDRHFYCPLVFCIEEFRQVFVRIVLVLYDQPGQRVVFYPWFLKYLFQMIYQLKPSLFQVFQEIVCGNMLTCAACIDGIKHTNILLISFGKVLYFYPDFFCQVRKQFHVCFRFAM